MSSRAPSATISAPAPRRSQTGEITLPSAAPATTASTEVTTSAEAEPISTATRERPDEARAKVASWVLSPSSARKTAANVENSAFQSMRELYGLDGDRTGRALGDPR